MLGVYVSSRMPWCMTMRLSPPSIWCREFGEVHSKDAVLFKPSTNTIFDHICPGPDRSRIWRDCVLTKKIGSCSHPVLILIRYVVCIVVPSVSWLWWQFGYSFLFSITVLLFFSCKLFLNNVKMVWQNSNSWDQWNLVYCKELV